MPPPGGGGFLLQGMPKVKHDNLDKLGALKDGKDGDKDNGGVQQLLA